MSAFALDWGVLWVCWESWSTISESTHQWITLYKWCFLISNRFLEVGWLNPRVNAHMVWLGMPTPFSIGDGPSYTPTSIWDVSASHSFTVDSVVDLLKCGGLLFNICLSLLFFSPRLKIYRLHNHRRAVWREILGLRPTRIILQMKLTGLSSFSLL